MKLKIVDTTYNLGIEETVTNTLLIADFDTGATIKALISAKGSILAGSAAGALAELLKGTDGQVIAYDSAEPTGLKPKSINTVLTFKQLWVGGWRPTLTNGCAYSTQIEMGTNKNVYDYCAFDKDAVEYAYANVPMPQDYTGGVCYAKFYWTHPATTTNFKVSWGIQAVSFSDDDTLDAAQGTAVYANDIGGTTSDHYISPQSADFTIAGTPAAGDLIQFRASRKADDATNDTLAVDAYLIGAMVWYPVA